MSQFIVLAIVAVITLVLWKRFVPPPADGATSRRSADAKTLERDPATGVYRQSEHDRQPRHDQALDLGRPGS